MKSYLFLLLKGAAMGAANVIPGVSGGTLALITGIFERLIHAVKSFDMDAVKLLFKADIKGFWNHVDGNFLVAVFSGIAISILSLARLFKFLLENETYSVWLMAFFFGLIVVSVYFVGKTVARWSVGPVIALLLGLAVAVVIAFSNPANENDSFFYLLICGIVAMASMILPGLSGSFVLILMGNYKLIMLDAVSELNLRILLPVALGAGLGLLGFSWVLAWVFKHFRDITLALMTGFILGSLATIWPWKKEIYMLDPETGAQILKKGKAIVAEYDWYLPELSQTETLVAIGMMVVGAAALWGVEMLAVTDDGGEAEELPSP